MSLSHLSHLDCPRCGRQYDADVINNLCECGSPLLARYDLASITTRPGDIAARPHTMWRYHEVLPVRERVISLGEGMTPLLPLQRLGLELGVPGLLMKDDGLIPTGSFKARGAAVGVSRAAELGVSAFAMPSNGNAASAWAAYGARAGLRSVVAMPVDAPSITRTETVISGAQLYLVRGHIGDAGRMIADLIARSGGALFDASTLKEPYRIEGKKTMGYEIIEQLGWRCPDVIVYPTGGGVGLIGIYKALQEMQELGWISGPLPRLVAVQSSGCAPIVQAFEAGKRTAEQWPDPRTVAFGLTVPKPLGDFLILDALYATKGTAVAVDDTDTVATQARCAQLEGAFVCPEGAATLAAVRKLRESGWLAENHRVVVLNTGAGMKYPFEVSAPAFDPADTLPG
ncbi:threonine synthase [Kibdelosporangium banguiense]|uniref:Threonine synthase n=1 Tax=Kibdelosporangium banguiense TaxID=1365924 RepID=A0ABS4T7G4_9PSEU|nr:threonine synthase [Kibdelosporangium banguiense]MBP2320323.1 threonine synthase [Kibdelosporangium banguiense]